MSGQHVGDFGQRIVLHVGADGGNFGVLDACFIQAGEETAPARLGLLGDLVVEVTWATLTSPVILALMNSAAFVANDLAIGGIVGGVATGQPGRIARQIHVGDGDLDTLGGCVLQVRDGGILAQRRNGDAAHALGDVGLDQFSFLGLVVVGIGGQDLDAVFCTSICHSPGPCSS